MAHPDGHEDRDVLDLAAPGPLQPQAVQEHVRVLPLDRPVPPRLDPPVNLLIEVANGRGTHARPPQGLFDAGFLRAYSCPKRILTKLCTAVNSIFGLVSSLKPFLRAREDRVDHGQGNHRKTERR